MTSPGQLSRDQCARLAAVGESTQRAAGEEIVAPGDRDYTFALIHDGEVEVVRPAAGDRPEEVLQRWGPGEFTGEWGLITGEAALFSIRVSAPSRLTEIARDRLIQTLAGDVDLSTAVYQELLRRRRTLRSNDAAASVQIVGPAGSPHVHQLRSWADRQGIIYTWLDSAAPAGESLRSAASIAASDLPVVFTPQSTLRRATVANLSAELGLSYRDGAKVHDLVVVGAGPAGLAAAVYGASEGLATILLDAAAVGGQAAASSRIENYVGFPNGISGQDLTTRGLIQAQKFGAAVSTPSAVINLERQEHELRLTLDDRTQMVTRSVIVATGARYRRLAIPRWDEFEGSGIYFAATELEAESCHGQPCAVIGGANSAGQAALFLAARGNQIDLVVRGADLGAGMSDYLVARIVDNPAVTVQLRTEIEALFGGPQLEAVTMRHHATGLATTQECRGLFCFIGAAPATDWIRGIELDPDGFIRTDNDLGDDLGPTWTQRGRRPFPYETSIPGVLAAGDVRSGSMKRVAAAVGEGSSAVRSVHRVLSLVAPRRLALRPEEVR